MISTLTGRNGNQGYWNPFEAFRRDMDTWMGGNERQDLIGHYPVDIHEDENFIHVHAELPGFKKEEIEVTLEKGILSIAAQRKAETEGKGTTHLSERRFTRVARAFTLPNIVDEGKVEASFNDGVLQLKLYKREEVKARRIEVK